MGFVTLAVAAALLVTGNTALGIAGVAMAVALFFMGRKADA